MLKSNLSCDEFTSVVDRSVAKSCCWAVQKFIRKNKLTGIVFASCHHDILEWLEPDWCFDTFTGELLPRGSLQQRPSITINVFPCDYKWWAAFKTHHYMSDVLSKSARCWLAEWDGKIVGFVSAMRLPSGTTKNAWREHRTVVLPDYQGLGIGVRISDAVASLFKEDGCRYYSKTAHPRMGYYRDNHPLLWRPTKHNHKRGKYHHGTFEGWGARTGVFMYSHEYVGGTS
jgi:GNAT superfamily N-acetyltransferase